MFPIFMGVILLIMLLLVECLQVLMHEVKYLFIWTDKYWFKLSLHWLVNFTGLSYVLFTDAWVSMSAYIWIHCVFICILAKYHVHMHTLRPKHPWYCFWVWYRINDTLYYSINWNNFVHDKWFKIALSHKMHINTKVYFSIFTQKP